MPDLARLLAPLALAFTTIAAAAPAPAEAAVITYDVQGRDNRSDLEAFATAAAETYADPRGWSAGGAIRFERVPAGQDPDFALWLAADGRMPSFGGACDHVWSCRSGRNVVINEDRWLGASPAWNEAGASRRDYRHMVVNHETGHWLGLGHQTCPAAGSPAPVMQQQSMGLQGCLPNPWPAERGGQAGGIPRVRFDCGYVAWRREPVACPR